MDRLSEAMHMNRRSLTIHFKEEMHLSIPDYVLAKKAEEAAYLLTSSDMGQLQIGELLCFSSQSHFIRKFRQVFGMTPKEYRNRTLK